MEFDKKEKELLKLLVKKELDDFEEDEKNVHQNVAIIALEEKYDMFLKKLLDKLK